MPSAAPAVVIHPKKEPVPIDRDFAIFLQEWDVPPGAATPDPNTATDRLFADEPALLEDGRGPWSGFARQEG